MNIFAALIQNGRQELAPQLGAAMRRHADALVELDMGERAVEIYRETLGLFGSFQRDDLDAQAEFAGTLLNYAECLRRLERPNDALEPLDQARELFGRIGFGEQGDPTQIPRLALTQINRGKVLAELGQTDEALAALDEGVAIYAQFAEKLPDPYALRQADALDAKAGVLRMDGRFDEALEPAGHAVAIVGQLAREDAVRYIYPLARMTNNLGRCMQQAEQFERAAPIFERAVEGFRILARAHPRAHQTTLIQVMSNYALALAQAGQLDEAHRVATESVGLAREVPELISLVVGGLRFMADLSLELERPEDAVRHLTEALGLLEPLLDEHEEVLAMARAVGSELLSANAEVELVLPDEILDLLERLGQDD